jgi:DNA-binding GntR family transcriptional regulator
MLEDMSSDPGTATVKRPKYQQIKESLLADYIEGQPAGHMLPPERVLAQEFGVTRVTLRRAIDELEADGLVYRVQGGGTYCVGPAIAKSLKLTSFSEDIRARGRKPSSVVLHVGVTPAGEEAGRALRLSPSAPVLEIRRLRRADGEPMCLEACALPAESVPGLADLDLTGSLYELVGREFGLHHSWAEQLVEATVLGPEDAKLLGVPAFSAALRATRVSYDARGKAIEYCVTTYRADRYSLRFAIRRD